jgi:SAM-dependent methyltransferase
MDAEKIKRIELCERLNCLDDETFSKTIQKIRPSVLAKVLDKLVKTQPELTGKIFSVGCGNGIFELYAMAKCGILITGVDPEPESFLGDELYILSEYSTVRDIPGEFICNCTIMLIHPEPTGYRKFSSQYIHDDDDANRVNDDDDDGSNKPSYDVESIKVMKPNKIFIAAEFSGSAGSYELLNTILHMSGYKLKSLYKPDPTDLIEELLDYDILELQIFDAVGLVFFACALIKKQPNVEHVPNIVENKIDEMSSCAIA